MNGEVILTARQTGLGAVLSLGDGRYSLAGREFHIDDVVVDGRHTQAETEQERASFILLGICERMSRRGITA